MPVTGVQTCALPISAAFDDNEMSYLHQHLFWRVSKREGTVPLPEVGEELWVRIPPDKVYLVTR